MELYELRTTITNWRLMIQSGRYNAVLTNESRTNYVQELVCMEIALRGSTPAAYIEVAGTLVDELSELLGKG